MDWTERLNKIIEYIESSLQLGHEELDQKKLSSWPAAPTRFFNGFSAT
ncbi:MAG: hypothetical protein EUB_03358 [Eubacterium sp.]